MAEHTNPKITYIDIPDNSGVNTTYAVNDNSALHSSSEIEFDNTDFDNFKDPMMSYVAENLAFDNMSDSFKTSIINLIKENISNIMGGNTLLTDDITND